MPFDRLRRRDLIRLLGGAVIVSPLAAQAQRPLPMIGILRSNPREAGCSLPPFRRDMWSWAET